MQDFIDIPSTDSLQNSRLKLMNNDKSIMSCHSGTFFPTNNLQVGMLCLREDLNQLFELKDLTPNWVLIADLNKTHTSKEYVDEQIGNHGNHVPAKETANNKKFLRNDNTWYEVTPANIGAAPTNHNQDANTITTGILPIARGGTGNANGTADKLTTARKINGVDFDGAKDITITAEADGGNAATVGGKTIDDIMIDVLSLSEMNMQIFTSSTIFVVPEGVKSVCITGSGGGGGGGGGYDRGGNGPGTAGGTTSFGDLLVLPGGGGGGIGGAGASSPGGAAGGAGGAAGGGGANISPAGVGGKNVINLVFGIESYAGYGFGGDGAAAYNGAAGGGGGSGDSITRTKVNVTPGDNIPITIGAAGEGGAGISAGRRGQPGKPGFLFIEW